MVSHYILYIHIRPNWRIEIQARIKLKSAHVNVMNHRLSQKCIIHPSEDIIKIFFLYQLYIYIRDQPRAKCTHLVGWYSRLRIACRVIKRDLTLEGEAGTELQSVSGQCSFLWRHMSYLVGSLVELLGVKGATETQGDALAEEDVVANGGDAAVVELDLGKGDGVDAVLRRDLEADGVARLGVPGGLGTGLDLGVDLVVVRGGKDAEVVGGSDGGAVLGGGVANGGRVGGDGGLVDVVTSRGTGEEALVADDGVNVGGGALEEVEKGAAVEAGLLEEQVELGALGGGGGEEVEETLKLQALGEGVVDLELGVENVGSVPGLGEGETCRQS